MSKRFSLAKLLDIPLIARVRRNHALEHATMHILNERHQDLKTMGRSSLWGFYIYGDAPADSVLDAAQEGLRQLKAGRHQMAIHPNCGSNLVVAGTIAGLGAFLALGGFSTEKRSENGPSELLERLTRLPLACAVATLGIVLARPLGAVLQNHVTTQADVGDMRIVSVTREIRAGAPVHFIRTEG